MKITLVSLACSFPLVATLHAAEVTATLSEVHLCCGSCVTSVDKTLAGVKGVTGKADRDSEKIMLTGADTATVQKAVDALVAAGVYGKSDNPAIKVSADTGAKGQKVKSLKIEGVHLCCGQCVSTVEETLMKVTGVKTQDAKRGAKSFTVTGDFNDQEVFEALHKAGLNGKVARD